MELFCFHESTVRPNTYIAVENAIAPATRQREYAVVVRAAGTITYREQWSRETRARERFERVVETHEKGESQ